MNTFCVSKFGRVLSVKHAFKDGEYVCLYCCVLDFLFSNWLLCALPYLTQFTPPGPTWPLPHGLLLPELSLFIKNIMTAIPRRKQIAEPTSNLVSSRFYSWAMSVSCLNAAESFSRRTDLRSSSNRRSFCVSSFLAFCTLVYCLRASSCNSSSLACCSSWLRANALLDSSRDYHFCTYSDSLSAYEEILL